MQLPQIFVGDAFVEPGLTKTKLSLDALDALRVIRLRVAAVNDALREVTAAQADVDEAIKRVAIVERIAPKYGFMDLWRESIAQR